MTTPSGEDNPSTLQRTPRQLTDDVLQSAEEAVLASSVYVEGGLTQTPHLERGPVAANPLSRYQVALVRYVAREPYQSALMAAAAGALAVAVLRSAVSRRRR